MASEPIYKVFVSSTFEDLREERAEVQKALLKLNCLPVGMELFPAADDDTWDFIKQQINDSDYYVVLIGARYGSLAPDGVSFTEKEFDYAREREIPSIGFIHGDRGAIPFSKTENNPDMREKLDVFISKIRKRPVRAFTSPYQLAAEVTTSFVDLKRARPRTGFVRRDEVVEYKKYADLLEKVAYLEKQLLDSKMVEESPFIGHDRTVKFGTVEVSWGTIFLAVATTIVDFSEEGYLAKHFFQRLIRYQPDAKAYADASLEERSLREIGVTLFAANLIDRVDEQQGDPRAGRLIRFWKLTGYGRRQFGMFRRRLSNDSF
jgi:hypothetical protein